MAITGNYQLHLSKIALKRFLRSSIAGVPRISTLRCVFFIAQMRGHFSVKRSFEQAVEVDHFLGGGLWGKFGLLREFARENGFTLPKGLKRPVLSLDLGLPKLVLCAEAFEFRGLSLPACEYVGPCLKEDRNETEHAFAWERLDPRRRLFYCALSTLSIPKRSEAEHLYRSLGRLFAQRPEDQLVVAVQKPDLQKTLAAQFPHVIWADYAPQLALLRRAPLIITHGGLNSIKESIWFGVPMVVLPFHYDQPGNAARVAHHQIGVVGKIGKLSDSLLQQWLDRALNDECLNRNLAQMRRAFHEDQAADDLNQAVTRLS